MSNQKAALWLEVVTAGAAQHLQIIDHMTGDVIATMTGNDSFAFTVANKIVQNVNEWRSMRELLWDIYEQDKMGEIELTAGIASALDEILHPSRAKGGDR